MHFSDPDLVARQIRLDRQLHDLAQQGRQTWPESLSRELREVLDFIHEHLFEPGLNVKSVKEGCGIRTNNISCRFRWALGIGLRDYIEARRMEAADQLLRSTDIGVFDLAMSLGYEHETTFYRAFRRHFRCPPSEHRLLARNSAIPASRAEP